jgi:hypothetical protein
MFLTSLLLTIPLASWAWNNPAGWTFKDLATAGVCGFFSLMFLYKWARPPSLHLREGGFLYKPSFGGAIEVAWSDVKMFRVWQNPSVPFQTFAGWVYDEGRGPKGLWHRINARLGASGALTGLKYSPQHLVEIMNHQLEVFRR